MDANEGEHFGPSGATMFEYFRAINTSLLRSKDRCVKYIDTVSTVSSFMKKRRLLKKVAVAISSRIPSVEVRVWIKNAQHSDRRA